MVKNPSNDSMKEVLGNYEEFVNRIGTGLTILGVKRKLLLQLDHLCYRVETVDRYHEAVQELGKRGVRLTANKINGREISVFELEQPVEADGWKIPFVEVPMPKRGQPYSEGLEHAEFVVGNLKEFEQAHPNLLFKPGGDDTNPVLTIEHTHLPVKFHERPLDVVALEQQRSQV